MLAGGRPHRTSSFRAGTSDTECGRITPILLIAVPRGDGLSGSFGGVRCSDLEQDRSGQSSVNGGRKLSRNRRLKTEHRSEEHTSELQSRPHLVCRLLLEKKKKTKKKLIDRTKKTKKNKYKEKIKKT